ncbi:MAG: VWA domain-containing protein [Anaerolineae bacterium]
MSPKIDPEKDYYAFLDLSVEAEEAEIKQAYRQLARRYHPDAREGDEEAFRRVQEAYEVLGNRALRRAYDRQREARGLTPDAPISCDFLLSRTRIPAMDSDQMIYLLVEIEPARDLPKQRQSLNLALVIDRSTSMSGHRIENVKLAAHDLVDSLRPSDRLAVVAFSDRAEILAESTRGDDKVELHSAISHLHPGGGTEIYRGLVAGLDEVRRHATPESIDHVIFLTDGRTYGDESLALAEAQRAGAEGIGISALGIGEDWNDLFLDALARRGNGVSEYINSPTQIRALLRDQIRDLGSIVARGVRLQMTPTDYVRVPSVYRVAPYIENMLTPSGEPILLGNLSDETVILLMEIVVRQPQTGDRRMVRLDLEANTHDQQARIRIRRDVVARFVMGRPEPEAVPMRLLSLLARLSIFRLQEQAWEALESGNAEHATHLLESAATRLFDMGYRELAQAALVEAGRVSRGGTASLGGRKKLRYGTRSLSARPKRSDRL